MVEYKMNEKKVKIDRSYVIKAAVITAEQTAEFERNLVLRSDEEDIVNILNNFSKNIAAIKIAHIIRNSNDIEYETGRSFGYEAGYEAGYEVGYESGYDTGCEIIRDP